MGIQIGIQISLMAGMQRDGKEMCIVAGNRIPLHSAANESIPYLNSSPRATLTTLSLQF